MGDHLIRNPAAVWRSGFERVVVLAPGGAAPHVLEPPGAMIWGLLAEPASVDDLVARLLVAFDAPEPVVRRDVERFVSDLAGRDLLVVDPPAGSGRP